MDKDTASLDPVTIIDDTTLKPFTVDFKEEAIDDLRRRIAATRWPTKELVADRSQGVQLAAAQALARYWSTEYNFGRVAERLNALPQFKTELDGLNIHFIHVRSPHANALPLVMTHGWPGSIIELLETIDPLTDPTAHGGNGPRSAGAQFASDEPGMSSCGASVTRGTSRRVATWAHRSPMRWAACHLTACSASTPIC